jgi:hypothetical protein
MGDSARAARECSDGKIVSHCRDQARWTYNGAVFRGQKGNSGLLATSPWLEPNIRFIESRQSRPQNAPYTDEEIALYEQVRALNARTKKETK